MRIAVLSDIHANVEALDAVLAHVASARIETCLVVGDVVGYGADPAGCVERIMRIDAASVAGNHDWAAVGRLGIEAFNESAAAAIRWTASQLGSAHKAYLQDLPLERREAGILMVHSSPRDPAEWPYLADLREVRRAASSVEDPLCVVGHSHVPFVYGRGDGHEVFHRNPGVYPLRAGWRYLVNVGSVGQPRDGDPRSSVGIVDSDARTVELLRIPYPVRDAQAKIRAIAALPDFLAWRLQWGV